ncbi:facilitated trehalose transporter Tret1 [Halyomorpha halys]|uniref:facilitated trehalose transporter Tret1 n=1 Tax=Halyomorpha halys TaxID=286706 RepID=UPI0006D51965|nr:facilitated trehalose transporter Tret1 [Halyomorpha halys]
MTSSTTPQYLYTLAATIVVIAGGSVIGWSSPALPQLEASDSEVPLTPEQASWVGSLLTIGCFFGALPAGSIADYLGRKWAIMSMTIPLISCWVLIFFAKTAMMLYIARLIGGLGLGALCTLVPMYVGEIAEDSIRGTLGTAFQLMIVIGLVYAYSVGAAVKYTMLPLLCGSINIIFLIAYFRAPESPVWLVIKGRRKQAEASLRRLRGELYDPTAEIEAVEDEVRKQNELKVPFMKAMGKRASIRAFIMCLGCMFFQQVSGINIVIFYAGNIFKDAGSSMDPAIAAIMIPLAMTFATIVSALLIDRLGRKILLQMSAAAMIICLGVLGYFFYMKENGKDISNIGLIPIAAMILYVLMFGIGYGPIPWLMSSELLAPEIKSTCSGIAAGFNWLCAFVVTKSFQPLVAGVGSAVTFWIFSGFNVLSLIFVTFVLLETKGKNIAEVQEILSGRKK